MFIQGLNRVAERDNYSPSLETCCKILGNGIIDRQYSVRNIGENHSEIPLSIGYAWFNGVVRKNGSSIV